MATTTTTPAVDRRRTAQPRTAARPAPSPGRVAPPQGALIGLQRAAGNGAAVQFLASVQREPEKKISGVAMHRIELAKAAIAHTKQVFSMGAGNQREALQAHNFNTYFKLLVMRNMDEAGNEVPESTYWNFTPEAAALASTDRDAKTAAKADLVAGGNCGEHAQVAFDHLRVNAAGERINRVDVTGLDHAFNIIGAIGGEADEELVVADGWPTAATATTWADHFAHVTDRSQINVRRTAVADGQNTKAVIAAGLTLTDAAKTLAAKRMTDEETAAAIAAGTAGEHPWIWDHHDTAATGRKFEYREFLRSPRFKGNSRLERVAKGAEVLKYKARDKAVAIIQQALVDDGLALPKSTLPDGTLDGIFGSETREKVKEWQRLHHLDPDGAIGKDTMAALDDRFAAG